MAWRDLSSRLEGWLDDHVPGDDDEQQEDEPRAPRPAAQQAGRVGVVAGIDRALNLDRGVALEDRPEQERGREEGEGEHDPALPEAPLVVVEDEADAEADDRDRGGGEHDRSGPAQASAEAGDRV